MTKTSMMIGGALMACAVALPAYSDTAAQTVKINQTDPAAGTSNGGVVSRYAMSGRLAAYGRTAHDPYALVEAARIQMAVGGQDVDRSKTSEAGTGDEGKKENGGNPDTATSLLTEASVMAGDSEVIAALIDDVKSSAAKGVVGGPKRHEDDVNSHDTDVYRVTYRGGEEAEVAILGDGDTDLDLHVYDENGNSICSDTDSTDRMYCSWYPRWSGAFTVKIKNYGNVYNHYLLLTN